MGVPEMEAVWNGLSSRYQSGSLGPAERKFFKKFVKMLDLLRTNPQHNSLWSHEIEILSKLYGVKIFQSYLENNTPAAGRVFWAYGPEKQKSPCSGWNLIRRKETIAELNFPMSQISNNFLKHHLLRNNTLRRLQHQKSNSRIYSVCIEGICSPRRDIDVCSL